MAARESCVGLVQSGNLQAYFKGEVADAMEAMDVRATSETAHYLVGLLTSFSRSERLFERTRDGVTAKPLAMWYADAVRARGPQGRYMALRQLGDVALFFAGVFSQSLKRKQVGVDYYVAMGERAYGYLSASVSGAGAAPVDRATFGELAEKFAEFADVIGTASDAAPGDNREVLEAYELWLRTASPRARRRLVRAGVTLVPAAAGDAPH